MERWYKLSISATLLGNFALVREWGRIGAWRGLHYGNCFGPRRRIYRRNAHRKQHRPRDSALLETEPAPHASGVLPALAQTLKAWRSLGLGKLLALPIQ